MNKIFVFFGTGIFMLLLSCNENNTQSANTSKTVTKTTIITEDSEVPTTKYFEGEIGNKPHFLILQIENSLTHAVFFDEETHTAHELFKDSCNTDSLCLLEYRKTEGDFANEQAITWKGKLNANKFEGYIVENNKKQLFSFYQKSTPIAFKTIIANDTIVIKNSKTSIATMDFNTLAPIKDDDNYLNAIIYKMFGDSSFNGNMIDFVKKVNTLDTTKMEKDELAQMQERPYAYSNSCNVFYYHQNRLILETSSYVYLGGAHGSNQVNYSTIDLATKKRMTLKDVLSGDEIKKLPSLLEKKCRKVFGLTDTASLTEITFDENPNWLIDNYYITQKGIGFVYNQYEIAPYAVGIIHLYIPFADIKS